MKSQLCYSLLLLLVCQSILSFHSVQAVCAADTDGCKTCDEADENCVECLPKFYFDSVAGTCTACTDSDCETCSTAVGVCEKCSTGFFVETDACSPCNTDLSEQCITCSEDGQTCNSCEEGFFVKENACVACSTEKTNCLACNAAGTTCEKCEANYFLSAGSCTKCASGTYSAIGATECTACEDEGCAECSGAGEDTCSSCQAMYIPAGNACTKCPNGQFSVAGEATCQDCEDDNCAACTAGGEGKCSACDDKFYVVVATGLCAACADEQCLTCSGSGKNKCTKCDAGYAANANGVCVECQDTGCAACSAIGTGKCTSCDADYYLKSNLCAPCPEGTFSAAGANAVSGCLACSAGCKTCTANGATDCKSCEDGYIYSGVDGTCTACDDENCKTCAAAGSTDQCTKCADGFFVVEGSTPGQGTCGTCVDEDCATCTSADAGSCTGCKADFYGTGTTCTECGDTKYSSSGSTTASQCKTCDDANCLDCSGAGAFKCTGCAANFYLDTDSCVTCGDGKYSDVRTATEGGCSACGDTGCKTCPGAGEGVCTVCLEKFYLTSENKCGACADTNCVTCTGGIAGQCTACSEGFDLLHGTCQATPAAEDPVVTKTGGILATIRYDMTLEEFNTAGGRNFFLIKAAEALEIELSQVEGVSVRQGSVIVSFLIYTLSSDATTTTEDLKTLFKAAVDGDNMNFYSGAAVLDSSSHVASINGCRAGQYLDPSFVCRACPDGCDTCSSADEDCGGTNVGAIVGGVIGGIALVVLLVVIYLKRAAIKKLVSPKGNYNKVDSSSKVNAQA